MMLPPKPLSPEELLQKLAEREDRARVRAVREVQSCIRRCKAKFGTVERLTFNDRLKAEIFSDQKGICGICEEKMDVLDFVVDHIVSLDAGGCNERSNLQAAHRPCNAEKGNKMLSPLETVRYLESRQRRFDEERSHRRTKHRPRRR